MKEQIAAIEKEMRDAAEAYRAPYRDNPALAATESKYADGIRAKEIDKWADRLAGLNDKTT